MDVPMNIQFAINYFTSIGLGDVGSLANTVNHDLGILWYRWRPRLRLTGALLITVTKRKVILFLFLILVAYMIDILVDDITSAPGLRRLLYNSNWADIHRR